MNTYPTRILFVCLGTIIRSPLAENMFIHLAQQAGKGSDYVVDSAGTGSWHVGDRPDSRMRKVAARRGFKYDGSSRQVRLEDFAEFDIIIAMDHSNKANLLTLARTPEEEKKVYLMRNFDPLSKGDEAVPDPYYDDNGFDIVFDIVSRSCQGLLDAIESGELG